jgi:hypothetical protein
MIFVLLIGLFSALAFGQQTARLQVIHNAADPSADSVDVYVNGNLLLDNFKFRTATPFIDVPANVPLDIGVAGPNSSSVNDTLKNFKVTFAKKRTYVAVANGVLDPTNFAPNPDNRDISFTIFAKDHLREKGRWPFLVDFVVLHGSTDAPKVDIIAKRNKSRWPIKIANNVSYGDFSDYRRLLPRDYVIEVTPFNDNNTVVASFDADLSGLGGGSAVVFASGFLNPGGNQNGAAFGIFVALANGAVVEFPAASPKARLQVIHNAADPAADSVDVYVNGGLVLDNFKFRTATPFIDVPANVALDIGVAGPNSSSVNDTLKNFRVTLNNGESYIAIANGVLDPNAFAPNPNGRSTAFTLFVKKNAWENSVSSNYVDLFAAHGATDAPKVNIYGIGVFLKNVGYGDLSNYLTVPANKNWLVVTTSDHPFSIVGIYRADLSGLGGEAVTVFASGFLNPSNNQNGASFAIFASLADGNIVELPKLFGRHAQEALAKVNGEFPDDAFGPSQTSVVTEFELLQNYPNPFNPSTTISFAIPAKENVTLKIYDITGQEVTTLINEVREPGAYKINFDASPLPTGVYLYRLEAGSFTQIRKMTLVK